MRKVYGPGPGRRPHKFCSISSELGLDHMKVLTAWEAHEFSQALAQEEKGN